MIITTSVKWLLNPHPIVVRTNYHQTITFLFMGTFSWIWCIKMWFPFAKFLFFLINFVLPLKIYLFCSWELFLDLVYLDDVSFWHFFFFFVYIFVKPPELFLRFSNVYFQRWTTLYSHRFVFFKCQILMSNPWKKKRLRPKFFCSHCRIVKRDLYIDTWVLSYKELISIATYMRLISIPTMYIRDRRLQTCDWY